MEKSWYCYILRSTNQNFKNRTYVGSTNNPDRRLKQHNRIIKGGAKATSIAYPYEFYCIISGFCNHVSALRCEWLLKHPDALKKSSNKYKGIEGRIKGLNLLLTKSILWKNRKDFSILHIKIKKDVIHLLDIEHINDPIEIF